MVICKLKDKRLLVFSMISIYEFRLFYMIFDSSIILISSYVSIKYYRYYLNRSILINVGWFIIRLRRMRLDILEFIGRMLCRLRILILVLIICFGCKISI